MSSKSSSGMGNELRLKGLKNVAGKRRVLGDLPLLEDLENVNEDVSGTADPESLPQNLPQAEGGELDSQGYDVRANQVINDPERGATENPDDLYNNRMHRLGKALKSQIPQPNNIEAPESIATIPEETYPRLESLSHLLPKESYENMTPEQKQVLEKAFLRNEAEEAARKNKNMPQSPPKANLVPPIETQQVEQQEGLPPMTPEGEEVAQGAVQELSSPESAEGEELGREARGTPALNIEDLPKNETEIGTKAVPGAVEEVIDNPELKAEMERVFGTEITPQMQQQLTDMEAAIKGYTDSLEGAQTNLTEHQAYLQQKIANQDLSAGESILMAMSVIAPALLMGLIAGKEGVIGGIAGGAEAVASNLANREKGKEEAYKLKSELGIKGAELGMKGLEAKQKASELKSKIQSNLPNAELKKLFDEVGGEIINGHLVFDTGNPLMPLKSSAIRRPKDYEQFMEKKKPDLSRRLNYVEGGIKNLDNIERMLDYAIALEKEQNIPGEKSIKKGAKAFIPAARTTYTDENGREIKLEQAFQTEVEQLSDAYSQSIGVGGSKGGSEGYRQHVLKQIPNPFTASSYIQGHSQLSTTKHQLQQIKNKLESDIVRSFDTAGIETTPIKELFKNEPASIRADEEKRKKNRAQKAAQAAIGE